MNKSELLEIKKGNIGTGLLIEHDGYISLSDEKNKKLQESVNSMDGWHCPYPFVVHAVFQKFGIKNANGRIYPENVLKKQVEAYQQLIKEKRALGECYTPDVLVLTEDGWKTMELVKEGEKVLTLNTNTNEIEVHKVIKKIVYDYDGDMIHINSRNIDDLVTPNHGYPIYNRHHKFDDFYTAENILNHEVKDQTESYIPKLNDELIKDIKISDIKYELHNSDDVIYLNDEVVIEKEYYKGQVMCLEVTNHTFYVMSNGKCHWSKNCNHPAESTIDLGRISHNITELHWEGRTLVGQMELNVTKGFVEQGICSSLGDTIANLLLNGYKIGVSSRGVGSVEQKMGQYIVGDDFELICWDVVCQPSTPNSYISDSYEGLRPYMESKNETKTVISEKVDKIKNILS